MQYNTNGTKIVQLKMTLLTKCIHSFMHICIYLFISAFNYLFIYSFIYVFLHLFISAFNYLFMYSFICLFIYLFISIFISSFICLFIYLFMYFYIYLFIYLFMYLFMYFYIYLFLHLCIYSFILKSFLVLHTLLSDLWLRLKGNSCGYWACTFTYFPSRQYNRKPMKMFFKK